MVDFSKRLDTQQKQKVIDPITLYDTLDRSTITGPLRPIQEKTLKNWYSNRKNEKDLIIKLHTGAGKTLIGLLMLQSRLNEFAKPCLYVCPNKHLANQVCDEAKKFGFQFCTIDGSKEIPNDFIDGKSILITYIQKIFNGKTKFGLDNNYIYCDSIILDDSHACIETIKQNFTINIKKDHNLYSKLLTLFRDDLIVQGHGTFLEIEDNEYNSQLPVPYWSFLQKKANILTHLSQWKNNDFSFQWPLVKDNLSNFQLHVSGNEFELSPYFIPIERFGTFHKASQRILMSATTQDDSFFIKGLNFSKEAVSNPLQETEILWSGEKLILIPTLINEELERTLVIKKIATSSTNQKFGTVSIVATSRLAQVYTDYDAQIATTEQIIDHIQNLKNGNFSKILVLVNRYDGIDLPDETCRILVIDSKPYFISLADKYEEACRLNSDTINIKIAQKIEQGMGRSVRGDKDYSVIFLLGEDLIKFIQSSRTNKYFSDQTKMQIKIGFEVVDLVKEDINHNESSYNVIESLLDQVLLKRDSDWKTFYSSKMNQIKPMDKDYSLYELLELERQAEEAEYKGNHEVSSSLFQEIIDNYCKTPSEEGWYLQQKARCTYSMSNSDSNKIQISAFNQNQQLLKPNIGITYKKLEFIDENRINLIQKWIKKFSNHEELILHLKSVLADFTFGVFAEQFESAVQEIGSMLGFLSARPDKEFKTGPDNLWCGKNNNYIFFECKSEVDEKRTEINKTEASQMNSHCGWFQDTYGDVEVERIMIIPIKELSHQANFTHTVQIMRRSKVELFKENIMAFFMEFSKLDLSNINVDKISSNLALHKLNFDDFYKEYSEPYFKKKR
ncbi:MAG: DEAD/DEAH box helicase [Clostridiales bacterium]